MSKIYLILSLFLIVLVSCKKDTITAEEPTPFVEQPATPDYFKLAVGNYWVYQRFQVDTDGVATPQNNYDSCYVEKDTIINNKTFYKLYRPNSWGSSYIITRDSSTCLINQWGGVFSLTNYNNIYNSGYSTASPGDTIAKVILKVVSKDSLVSTPAGVFATTNDQAIHYMYPAWRQYYRAIYSNKCYAAGVGIVLETLNIIYGPPYTTERRLVRYHVN